jgi:hypothetical protein
MRPLLLLFLAVLALFAVLAHAEARIQRAIVCVDPDMEFPVACDEDDED